MGFEEKYKELKKDHSKMKPNIYENNITVAQHAKKFHFIHFIFKHRFFTPLLDFTSKFMGKYLYNSKTIPKASHNRNILIFDKAYEEAIKKWYIYYIRNDGEPEKRKGRAYWLKKSKNERRLRVMKELVLTIYQYDTAYREFVNILMHEITIHMQKEYTKPEYKDKKTGHLMYTVDIHDPHYYVLEKYIRYNYNIGIADAERLLQEHYAKERAKHDKRHTKNKDVLESSDGASRPTIGNL